MLRNLGMITAVAALALTQQACAGAETSQTPAAAPTTSAPAETSPAPETSASAAPAATTSKAKPPAGTSKPKDPILAGKRQVVIVPAESFESIVVLDDDGNLSLTDGEAEHGLFVLTPHNGKYLIKTAKVTSGGEPDCIGVKSNGTQSLTGVATACDTSKAGQLFDIEPTGKKENGSPTYSIANQSAFLQITRSGLIFEELGDAPLLTTYSFADNGASTLPTLG